MAETLREARLHARLRQQDLATRLGRTQAWVSAYETKERTLDFLDVRDICEALGISFDGFVRRFVRGR